MPAALRTGCCAAVSVPAVAHPTTQHPHPARAPRTAVPWHVARGITSTPHPSPPAARPRCAPLPPACSRTAARGPAAGGSCRPGAWWRRAGSTPARARRATAGRRGRCPPRRSDRRPTAARVCAAQVDACALCVKIVAGARGACLLGCREDKQQVHRGATRSPGVSSST